MSVMGLAHPVRLAIRKLVIRCVFMAADIFGFWRYPSRLDAHAMPGSRLARLYWTYKAHRPVVRAERHSGLEAYFNARRGTARRHSLPQSFQAEHSAALSAVGDLMRAPGLDNSQGRLYAQVHDLIFEADVTFANLESSVIKVDPSKGLLSVEVTRQGFEALTRHGSRRYDVLSTANNHALDGGFAGIADTHNLLDSLGFQHVGTNLCGAAQRRGLIFEANGIRLGFLAATFSVNHQPIPADQPYLVNLIAFHTTQEHTDTWLLEEQMAWCRDQRCDLIILSLHWGADYEFFPRRFHVALAHALVEKGADVILSHHSHTIQPYESYPTKRDPDRRAPIFYGLGNLTSWSTAPYRCLSLVARLELAKGQINGISKTLVSRVDVTPVLQVQRDTVDGAYQQLGRLAELVDSDNGAGKGPFIRAAVPYADLVLGDHWRSPAAGLSTD